MSNLYVNLIDTLKGENLANPELLAIHRFLQDGRNFYLCSCWYNSYEGKAQISSSSSSLKEKLKNQFLRNPIGGYGGVLKHLPDSQPLLLAKHEKECPLLCPKLLSLSTINPLL